MRSVCLSVCLISFANFSRITCAVAKTYFFSWTVFFDNLCTFFLSFLFDRLKFSSIQKKKKKKLHLPLIIMSVCLQEEAPCSDNKPWPSEMKPWNTKERTFVYILTVENAQFLLFKMVFGIRLN